MNIKSILEQSKKTKFANKMQTDPLLRDSKTISELVVSRVLEEYTPIIQQFIENKIKELANEISDAFNEFEDKIVSKEEEIASQIPNFDTIVKEVLNKLPPPEKGDQGDSYILSDDDKKEIASKIEPKIVEKVIEKRIEVIKEKPIITEITKKEIVEKAVTDKAKEIAKKLNKETEIVDMDVIKGLRKYLNVIEKNIKGITKKRIGGGGDIIKAEDLSSQCNGSLKIFTVPRHRKIVGLRGTQFPIIYRPNIDFTTSGTTLTLTDQVSGPNSGETLIFEYVV